MKILLIYPYFLEERIHEEDIRVPPIGLYTVGASAAAAGHDVKIVNWYDKRGRAEEIRQAIAEAVPDIIGVSILHGNRWGGIDIARMARKIAPRTPIVFGGIGATFLWEQLLDRIPEIDYAIIGEGEVSFLKIVQCVERNALEEIPDIPGIALRIDGRPARTRPGQVMQELDSLPDPARYFTFQHVVSSRGCPGNCSFCGSPLFWGRRVRFHGSDYFVDHLERHHRNGVKFFYISDDTFTLRAGRVVDICRDIIDRGLPITWAAISRVDAVSETVLKWMRMAGCIQISYGIESGSEKIRRNLNKSVSIDQVRHAFALTRRFGIMARAYFIYGCPGETDETIAETLELIRNIQPLSAIFYLLDIFPGTALYDDYIQRTGASDDIWMERIEDILYFQTDPALDREKILSWGDTLRHEFFRRLPDFAGDIDLTDDPDLVPFHADFLSRMGMTFSHGDYAQHPDIPRKEQTAEHLFRRALSYAPVHRAYLGLGVLLQKRGAAAESVALLREATDRYPKSDELQTCLGISYMNLGRFRDALSCFGKLIRPEPAAEYIAECQRHLNK
ncbi:hypothetical protein D3OALGA1CA_2164 [Olavius algarvensis associated proteobacterium Delta 3]|nr:hypothetical protein D3OALGA1CA_2164 [Olavius algarvensis associated proteobacterium Delta 3]CAB5161640.1 hypothetical protein D3OALGB2SA_5463 [Olavius algarvensis associated proteobacterium Delta 3]